MRILFLFFFISFTAHAEWASKVRQHLPLKVSSIIVGKTDREGARKLLGNPALIKGGKEYWIFDDFKYALELTYQGNKVSSLHYNFSKNKFSIEDLKKEIDPKLLKTSPSSPHTSLVYEDKEGKMEVELATGKVESVRFQ